MSQRVRKLVGVITADLYQQTLTLTIEFPHHITAVISIFVSINPGILSGVGRPQADDVDEEGDASLRTSETTTDATSAGPFLTSRDSRNSCDSDTTESHDKNLLYQPPEPSQRQQQQQHRDNNNQNIDSNNDDNNMMAAPPQSIAAVDSTLSANVEVDDSGSLTLEEIQDRKLFIGNLSFKSEKSEFIRLFASYGPIYEVSTTG